MVNINNILTGVYVDNTDNLYFEIRTGQNSFAEKIENHLAYQVLDLPAGAYRFSATNGLGIEGNNYIVVNLGDELCDNTTFRTEALAYNDLTDGEVVFILDEPSKVAVGLIFNMEGKQATSLKSFNLELVDGQSLKADGLTNIYDAVKSGKDNMFTPVNGGLKIVTDNTTNVRIYDINGICIFNDMVQGVHIIPLHEGIYIVNGITLEIKK